ncbi:hypothetical protein ACLMJK_002093 [Lecanora helva]
MSDSVGKVFVHALNTVKRIPRTGSARPPPSDRLKLYGLYKQSTEGDVEGLSRRPEGTDSETVNERDKWDAWQSNNGLSKTDAKRQYISTLIDTMHKYATTTPEARELVSELEFVWDQIKSNSVSSSGSSPGHGARPQGQQNITSSYASIGQIGSTKRDEGLVGKGLRLLRPVSDGDEDEEDNEEDEYEEPRARRYNEDEEEEEEEAAAAITGPSGQSGDFDVRNRKWRKRIERALVKMTAEVAALREQMEAHRIGESRRRNGLWAWMAWLVWVAVRHALVDFVILGIAVIWARRKRDKRVETGVSLLMQYLRERVRRLLWPMRLSLQK